MQKFMKLITKKILPGILGTLIMISFYSCAKKATATTSAAPEPATISVAPENKGQVLIKRDVNSNYVIQINLKELETVGKSGKRRFAPRRQIITHKAHLFANLDRKHNTAIGFNFDHHRSGNQITFRAVPTGRTKFHAFNLCCKGVCAGFGITFNKVAMLAAVNHVNTRAGVLSRGRVVRFQNAAKGCRDRYPRLAVNLLVALASERLGRHGPAGPSHLHVWDHLTPE